jgi:gamma-glutamyl-gamma-aminobutyraldehyde dehydrogenase/4-guanidinobutyraldehyde dehydrogenase/NAD-dependent aldehyde dehydrogenase
MDLAFDWQSFAASLHLDGRAFIGGRRIAAQDGAVFDCISPIDGRKIAEISRGRAADIDLAVRGARAAFEDGRWAHRPPRERKVALLRFADLLRTHADQLAALETLDMGKPVALSRSVDVPAAANCLRWYGEAIDKLYDEIAPTPRSALALITREPVGVVGAIVPWNYPLLMACWKIAPALASGNSVVLKPSEKASLSALRLGEIALEAGIPEDVFNVVPGFGQEAGQALALHPEVDCIAFTGSTRTGKTIVQCAGQSNLKRVWTELGGKSPFVVLADADVEAAARACAGAIFFNQGESCNAPSRAIVDRRVLNDFTLRVATLAQNYQPADPWARTTAMGAIVDRTQLNTVLGYIASAVDDGAHLVTGGAQAHADTGGFYVTPTVFSGVAPDMKIAREEVFGPVLAILPAEGIADAVAMANASRYGLAASIWSRDIDRALTVARALRAGTVHVNSYDDDDITVPFGGYKESGTGRDKSLHAFEKYTELKTTWIRLPNGLAS